MICPKCSVEMEAIKVEGIEVDRCVGCKGLWFDAREHEKLKDVKRAAATLDVGTPAEDAGAPTSKKIKCPSCHTQMIQMTAQGRAGLQFEACTVCHGAFFDAGEFRAYAVGGGVTGFIKGLFGRR
jgi:Zn-finger nucleic acid-binding protein